jgi:hypothetical protein
MKTTIFKSALWATALSLVTFTGTALATHTGDDHADMGTSLENTMTMGISELEVIEAQEAWGNGIVQIGEVYSDGGDYRAAAAEHIEEYYGYDQGKVLFKPTLASDKQFRNTFDAALSYFVGGNATFPEDNGFAIKPWTNVRWENTGIINNKHSNMALAMGNYYFTTTDGDEVKVEYTFAYTKDENGKLKIVAHKSALPYDPE